MSYTFVRMNPSQEYRAIKIELQHIFTLEAPQGLRKSLVQCVSPNANHYRAFVSTKWPSGRRPSGQEAHGAHGPGMLVGWMENPPSQTFPAKAGRNPQTRSRSKCQSVSAAWRPSQKPEQQSDDAGTDPAADAPSSYGSAPCVQRPSSSKVAHLQVIQLQVQRTSASLRCLAASLR